MKVKLFLDGAEIAPMKAAYAARQVAGFTTNPVLMNKAGISNYESFARAAIEAIPDLPISFEVCSDDFESMEKEARKIASWGGDTYVKIPITNTKQESSCPLIKRLAGDGISLNVTAILTTQQVQDVVAVINPQARMIVSVFAGRIADTGVDPVPLMTEYVRMLVPYPQAELLWASPRELLNVIQADQCGCQIITATKDIVAKMALVGKDLEEYSLETVKMLYDQACAAGYKIV